MALLEKLFPPKRHPVEDSGTLLLALARKRGLSNENRDLMLAWAVFKEFCLTYSFACDDDALLWEVGPYGRTGEGGRCFQWHLVRQFAVGPGEDEDLSQVHMDMVFSKKSGEEGEVALWSYDLEGEFPAFFAAVEAHPDFCLPEDIALESVSIGLDKV